MCECLLASPDVPGGILPAGITITHITESFREGMRPLAWSQYCECSVLIAEPAVLKLQDEFREHIILLDI